MQGRSTEANGDIRMIEAGLDWFISRLGISPRQLVLGGAWFGLDTVCEPGTSPVVSVCLRASDDRDQYRPMLPFWKPLLASMSDLLLSGNATTGMSFNATSSSSWFKYRDAGGAIHQVWLDTPRSLLAKYGAADEEEEKKKEN